MMHSPIESFRFSRLVPRSLLTLFMALFLMPMPGPSDAADLIFSPSRIDFGIVPIGDTAYRTLTLTNNNVVYPITVEDIVFTSNKHGSFGFSTPAPLPTVIPPGSSMEIELSFSPYDWGFAGADIRIFNNSGNAPSLYIYLSGAGFKR